MGVKFDGFDIIDVVEDEFDKDMKQLATGVDEAFPRMRFWPVLTGRSKRSFNSQLVGGSGLSKRRIVISNATDYARIINNATTIRGNRNRHQFALQRSLLDLLPSILRKIR